MLKYRLIWQKNSNSYIMEKLSSSEMRKLEEINVQFRKLKELYKKLFVIDDDEYKKLITSYRRMYNEIDSLYKSLRIEMNLDPYKV